MDQPRFDVQPGYQGSGHIPYVDRLASQAYLGLSVLEGKSSTTGNPFAMISEMLSRHAWGHHQTVAERILDKDYPIIGGLEPDELVDVADYLSTVAEGVQQTDSAIPEDDDAYEIAVDLYDAFDQLADQHRHPYLQDSATELELE